MESFEQSSLNISDNKTNTAANVDLHLQNHQDIICCNSNNNNNNNIKYINNNKMVSNTLIKHEMAGGLMPSVLTAQPQPPTTTTATVAIGNMVQMDNTNQSQTQQHQQQIVKSQQIVNKNSSTSIVNPHGGGGGAATTINSPKMGSRRIFTPQFKLQVLESYRNDNDCKGNQRATARKYNIHRRQIQKWLQCESNLRSSVANINQSQVKHQFHNITPNTTVTTTQSIIAPSSHNSQFVSQQQQHYQQQLKQNMNSSIIVPSTPTSTTTPCSAAGVLVAANFAAAVAAAASVSMANVDKHCGTVTTSALAPIRPTAIVGGSGSGDDVNATAGTGSILHPHAHLPHLQHHLPPHPTHHHHHHHVHPHAHHHHPYSTLPYTHSAVPILTHHQSLYSHSAAAAALLAAAHHHLPQHQIPNSAVLHHHHYQQHQQHEYHSLQQQQQQQQLFATTAAVTASVADREPLDVEVVGDADTESEADIGNHNSPCTTQKTIKEDMKTGNSNDYEHEQLEIENSASKCNNVNSNNNCNRVRLQAIYKLQQQQQHHQPQQTAVNLFNDGGVELKEDKQNQAEILYNDQAMIIPIDLSLNRARRHINNNNNNSNNNTQHHKILMTKDETVQKYDKHVPNSAYYDVNIVNDDVMINNEHHSSINCNQETTNNAFVVDLTFRKRKVMSKCSTAINALDNIKAGTITECVTASSSSTSSSSLANENKDDDTQPEKMPKFSAHQSFNASVSSNGLKTATQETATTIKIKEEHMSTHDVNTTTTACPAQNAVSKPVKLFKPYLLHEEEEEERQQEEEKFHLTKQTYNELQQNYTFVKSLTPSPQAVPNTETFQGVGSKNTFPIGSSYFQNNNNSSNGGSKPSSPKSVLCSPTSPIGFQRFSKGSPVSGYESSSSTYSECSSNRGLSHYSVDLQFRSVYSEQLASPPHSHYSPHNHQHQLLAATPQHPFQGWMDQDTQSSLATCSTRSSPTPTPTPPTTRTPPAANTSIALYA